MTTLQQAALPAAGAGRPVVVALPLGTDVVADLVLGVVVASVLSFVGVGAYCWRYVGPDDDATWVTKVVLEAVGFQRGLVIAAVVLYGMLALDALFDSLAGGLAVAVVLPAAVLVVTVAGLLPVAVLGLFERTPYGTFRDAVLDATLDVVWAFGGVPLGIALALHLSYWAVPLGALAVVGYHAGQPWFVEATNEVGPAPSDLLASLDSTIVSAVGEDRLRLHENDDVAQIHLMGIVPGFQRIYVTRKLLTDHPDAEVEALLEYTRSNVESWRNQDASLWWTLCAVTFLLAWVVSLWLLLALVPLLFLAARRLRDRVYAADAFAAERTSPEALRDALERLAANGFHTAEENGHILVFESFPSVADRIDRLGGDGGDPDDRVGTDDDDDRPGVGAADRRAVDDGPDSDGSDHDDWERLRA